MDMHKKAVPLALALAFALGAGGTGVTLAQETGAEMMGDESGMGMMEHGKGMGPGRVMMQEMQTMREMLSVDQPEALRKLMQEHRPAQFERMGHAKNLRKDLMVELQQDRPDPDAVGEMHGRLAEIHGEMMVERVRMRNAMYELVTDEQREQLADKTPDAADSN